ncbi:MAG: hypothetical protein K940chlam7_00385 [Chlamydiae bacterium]|nr:hypothetical protein [Chlamydiota bacterium]
MTKNWFYLINLSIAGITLLLVLLTMGYYFARPSEIPIVEVTPEKAKLPKGAFTMEKEKYDAIGPPFLRLKYSPMTLQLPDLRNTLIYYGKNERPDALAEQSLLHFSFSGSKEISSIPPETPLYLVYDEDLPRIKYRFSPNNEETYLWIKATPKEKEAMIAVLMKNESGEVVRKPEKHSKFTLREREFARFGGEKWEIGKWKVDGTLLARQRARWYGQDLFLEKHGGEEFKEFVEKQRIDFGEQDEAYSVYVSIGDALAWIGDKWQKVQPGEDSRGHPLLVVSKIEERLMRLDLWDVAGKGKVTLNLIKSTETRIPQDVEKTFKFVGARTRSQLMFEVKDERVIISPQDWFLYIDGEWQKLTTPKEIDDYVERKTVGPLFVVDSIDRGDGHQVLMGTIFNGTRTDMKSVEIPLQQSTSPGFTTPKPDARRRPPPDKPYQRNEEWNKNGNQRHQNGEIEDQEKFREGPRVDERSLKLEEIQNAMPR